MNNETHEDRVKILAGAPDGATYVEPYKNSALYWKVEEVLFHQWSYWMHERWIVTEDVPPTRSLADIQKLVDMQNEIDALSKQVEVLHNTYSIGGFD